MKKNDSRNYLGIIYAKSKWFYFLGYKNFWTKFQEMTLRKLKLRNGEAKQRINPG